MRWRGRSGVAAVLFAPSDARARHDTDGGEKSGLPLTEATCGLIHDLRLSIIRFGDYTRQREAMEARNKRLEESEEEN